jgi:hypothetical protein
MTDDISLLSIQDFAYLNLNDTADKYTYCLQKSPHRQKQPDTKFCADADI